MKKTIKLTKVAFVILLIAVMLISLTVGLLREIKKVEELSYSYVEYSAEGQVYGFRKYDSKLCYVDENGEIECQVVEKAVSVTVNDSLVEAIISEDELTLVVSSQDPEILPITFTRGEEPVTIVETKVTVYSDSIINFLGLNKFEDLIGRHYFNSIFCSLSGSSFVTLICLFRKSRKTNKKLKKKAKSIENSLKPGIPKTTPVNPTQGDHKLKF